MISMFYMIAQLNGSGALIGSCSAAVLVFGHRHRDLDDRVRRGGGMVATTWTHIIKALRLIAGTLTLSSWCWPVTGSTRSSFRGGRGRDRREALVPPPRAGLAAGLDVILLNIALVRGTAGSPHIPTRFFTVPDAKTGRSSIVTATWIIGLFYLLTRSSATERPSVGQDEIVNATRPATSQPRSPPRPSQVRFFAFISAVAFSTIVAVVAGLVVAASSAFAHDFYTNDIRGGEATEQEQFRRHATRPSESPWRDIPGASRESFNVAFLVALAFAVAASANYPSSCLSSSGRGSTRRGPSLDAGRPDSAVGLVRLSRRAELPESRAPSTRIIPIDAIFPPTSPALVRTPGLPGLRPRHDLRR